MSQKRLLLLLGPNLNLFGQRQTDVYGTETFEDDVAAARATAEELGLGFDHRQSQSEAELVGAVHEARGSVDAIVINAGALTHYGWSTHDALAAYDGVVVELHRSNTAAREPWRHTSVIAPVADGTVMGFGHDGYVLAVQAAARLLGR